MRRRLVEQGPSGDVPSKSGVRGFSPTAGGLPVPRSVVRQRLDDARAIYCNTLSRTRTIRQLQLLHGIARSTADHYIRRALDTMDQEWREHRPHVQAVHQDRVAQMIELARKDRKWAAVMQGEQLLARITGAMAPEKVDHVIASTDGYAAALADGWTDDQIAEYVRTGIRPDAPEAAPAGSNGHDRDPQVH